MPGLRERGRGKKHTWTLSTSWRRQPIRIWKSCLISLQRAQCLNSLACPSLSDVFLRFFFFYHFRIRATVGSEWLTSSHLLALGVDSFRIVANRYFRSPWQPPVSWGLCFWRTSWKQDFWVRINTFLFVPLLPRSAWVAVSKRGEVGWEERLSWKLGMARKEEHRVLVLGEEATTKIPRNTTSRCNSHSVIACLMMQP